MPPFQPRRILILQTAFIGDVILVEPLIAQTKANFPDAEIDVVVIPAAANVLETHPAIRDLIVYDKRHRQRGLAGFFSMLLRLRQARYDLALVPHRSLRSAALAWLASIPVRIGFDNSAGRFLFTQQSRYVQSQHEVVRNLSLLAVFGIKARYQKPELYLRVRDREKALTVMMDTAVSPKNDGNTGRLTFIAMAPGSIWATKRWPAEKFARLGRKLQAEFNCAVVLLGSAQDRALCQQIATSIGARAINLAGKLSLRESAALLQKCTALISNDSAPTHLGVAAGCSVATIFGATIPGFGFFPHGSQHKIIETDRALTCRPCGIHGGHKCPVGTFECMRSISVERVFAEVTTMIRQKKTSAPKINIMRGVTKADFVRAVELLKNDGVLLMPTETLYGLAASALSERGVRRIFAIKFRSQASPLPLICGSVEQVAEYCVLREHARITAEAFWPGPLTLVLPATKKLPRHIMARDGTVAVRVPSNDFCREIAAKLGAPITATSANISGEPAVQDLQSLPESLAAGVDLIFDNGKCMNRLPSTIVKIVNSRVDILREGVISAQEIQARIGVHSIEHER